MSFASPDPSGVKVWWLVFRRLLDIAENCVQNRHLCDSHHILPFGCTERLDSLRSRTSNGPLNSGEGEGPFALGRASLESPCTQGFVTEVVKACSPDNAGLRDESIDTAKT